MIYSEQSSKKLIRIQLAVLLTGVLIMFIKAVAYLITTSNVILTDALESLINVLAGGFALYSLILAAKPRDADHPYGHGKIEFISASVEATMIIGAGLLMIGKATYNFIYPHNVQDVDIGIYLTGGAGLVNFILGAVLVRYGKSHNSMTMLADGKHLLSDAYSTVGMIAGLILFLLTDLLWIDNALAMLFGAIISFTGFKILRKSLPGIMDEADVQLLKEIIDVVQENRRANWVDLHNLRVIKYGNVYHLDCHLTLPYYFTVEEAHDEMNILEDVIQRNFGNKAEMFIHNDPCKENSCSLCEIQDCKVRKFPFRDKVIWSAENVLINEQHVLD